MADQEATSHVSVRRKHGVLKTMWRSVRGPLTRSRAVTGLVVWTVGNYLRLVNVTNPRLPGSSDTEVYARDYAPFITAFWHGQHLMGTFMKPRSLDVAALFSRSADAELNARVVGMMGVEIVRGSGGRGDRTDVSKGGARALLQLKRILDRGKGVVMIADIPNGTPREAGQGIVLLAKLSGRPIIPAAYASSRHKVLEKSWDKTTIPFPFGRAAALVGEPVMVPTDADEAVLEAKRIELTDKLNAITARAYEMVGASK